MKYSNIAKIVFVLVVFACTRSSAAVVYWDGVGSVPTTDDWNTASNWQVAGQPVPTGAVPGLADHVIIHNDDPGGPDPLIAGAAVTQINIFTPSWHNNVDTVLNIGAGGSINTNGTGVSGFARLSGGNNSSSTVNFLANAGISVWNILQMSFNNAAAGLPANGDESDSFINLDGGILHLGSLGFSNNGLNTTNIDIGLAGTLLVNGDHTDLGNGNATTWINAGYLTAEDGTGVVDVVYDFDAGRTVFTVSTTVAGDFDGDGDVDGNDLTDPAFGFGTRYGIDLDGSDFLVWQRNFAPPSPLFGAVPEPSSLALLALAGICCMAGGRKK